jgi:predicted metal-dependent HD superfamily phosphohydrolase
MKELKQKLIKDASRYIKNRFRKKAKVEFKYHNLSHTKKVVKAAEKISRKYDLSKNDVIILLVSAWFHDIGFLDAPQQHEERGAQLVEKFLQSERVPKEFFPLFKDTILSTRMPQKPSTLIQEILCDADLYHLGTSDFFRNSKSLRKESQYIKGVAIDKIEWLSANIKLLKSHYYFTDYSRKRLDHRVKANLQKLLEKQKNLSTI